MALVGVARARGDLERTEEAHEPALRCAGKGGAPLRVTIAPNADRHAQDLAPVIEDLRRGGHASLHALADELNAPGILTRRGGRWQVSTVTNVLDRRGLREERWASQG